MCKRNYVSLQKGKRKYKLYASDIKAVYSRVSKVLPMLPKYEIPTCEPFIAS